MLLVVFLGAWPLLFVIICSEHLYEMLVENNSTYLELRTLLYMSLAIFLVAVSTVAKEFNKS